MAQHQPSRPELQPQATSVPHLDCGHQQLFIGNQHWPLRLIDISATLACSAGGAGGIAFTAKKDWDFHVISHTWSLSIREFSEQVGSSLLSSRNADVEGGGDGADLYSEAFRRADFGAEKGYKDLMEFLRILMEDGVKNVWFDAVCINQMDEEEKGREIMHMGSYYRYSTGCYVVNHGIGQGYDLLGWDKLKNEVSLPRWFTRVWTLQEFLLPINLYFLVSGVRRDVIWRINEQIKQHAAAGYFCNCCLWGQWVLYYCNCCTLPYWLCHNRRVASTDDGGDIILGSAAPDEIVICSTCKALPLIRKAKCSDDGQQILYFVERRAYQCLVSLHHLGAVRPAQSDAVATSDDHPQRQLQQPVTCTGPVFPDSQILGTSRIRHLPPPALPHINLRSWQLHFSQLYRLLASKCFTCDSMLFASLVQSRQCSVKHKEDRVLSVLCLLGLEGSMQVRTGQTLEQQWVEVARALLARAQSKQLLELCIQNIKFSWQDNASWTPNYCEFTKGHWLSMIRLKSERVQVKEVRKEGALRLEGMVVPARLVRQGRTWKEHKSSDPLARKYCSSCQHFFSVHKAWSRVHQQAMCHLEVGHNLCSIPLVANANIEETTIGNCIARRHACIVQSYPYTNRYEACLDCDQLFEGAVYLPLTCMHGLLELDVFLVLWGDSLHEQYVSVLGPHSFGEEVASSVVMVCVGRLGLDSGHQLHKIGVLDLPSDVTNVIFFHNNSSSAHEFLLGGFGSNVLQLWDSLVRIHGVSCGAYPSQKQGSLPLPQQYLQDKTTVEVIMNVVSHLDSPIVTLW